MLFFKMITLAYTFGAAMAERFINVITTTPTFSFVDNYQETVTASLFLIKQQSVSTKGSCAILCSKEKSQPCEGFTATIEQETEEFNCKLGKSSK